MLPRPQGTNYPPGNGDKWKFSNSLYARYVNQLVVSHGTYRLTKDTCSATGTYLDAFTLEQDSSHKMLFEFSNDTLVLYNGVIAADGTISKYVRLIHTTD